MSKYDTQRITGNSQTCEAGGQQFVFDSTAATRYLDDTLLTDHDKQSAERSLLIAQHTLTLFGLVVNPDKTEGPALQLAFLGIQLDSVALTLAFLGIQLDSVALTLSCTTARLLELEQLLDDAGRMEHSPIPVVAFLREMRPKALQFIHGTRMCEAYQLLVSSQIP